ncbi:MAG: MBL fold metallo-hydrolase [Myxococcales bacterium]|nr:MBL fold metallo-hydrolase [Myxococcales bacterium]
MAFLVRFWGTRGSIPTPGRTTNRYGGNTSCVEVCIDEALFICDGGTGLRELGIDLMKRGSQSIVAHLLFSHMHWDHIQGFPFFVPAYIPSNTFYIYGTSPGDRRFHNLLSGQMRSDYFPVDFSELNADIRAVDLGNADRVIDGVRVRCMEQCHPGTSYAYSFEKGGRKVVYATDNEIDMTLPDAKAVQADLAAPRKIPDDLVAFVRDADLLIVDGQYTDEQYFPKHVGWGHPRATTAVDLAVQAGARQLAIYHHDPMQSDIQIDMKIAACRSRVQAFGSSLFVFAAREGIELRIDQ